MKALDAVLKVVLVLAVLLWGMNQPIGCAEARQAPPPAPTPGPPAPGAPRAGPDDELRRVLGEIRESVSKIAAKVEADRKPGPVAPPPPPAPAPDDDPAARALGAKYRADVTAAHLAAMEAVAAAPAATGVADLIRLDNAADLEGRKAAWKSVQDELSRRFPDPAKADPAAVRAFYRELIAGWKGGKP